MKTLKKEFKTDCIWLFSIFIVIVWGLMIYDVITKYNNRDNLCQTWEYKLDSLKK